MSTAIGYRRLAQIIAVILLAALAASSFVLAAPEADAHSGRWYGTAIEGSGNYGVRQTRWDVNMNANCSQGFIYDGTWQGTENDNGWVEGGTTYCKDGYAGKAWWWAECDYSSSLETCIYSDGEFNRIGSSVDNHQWTVEYVDSDSVRVLIDVTEIHRANGQPWGYANTAEVGIEASYNSAYIQGHYLMSLAKRTSNSAGWTGWSGRDSCHSDSPANAHWDSDTQFHVGMNSSVSDSC